MTQEKTTDWQAIHLGDSRLLLPSMDEPAPVLSLVIPVYDEAVTIKKFVSWCHEGLAQAGVKGEILIVDSSSDNTAEIAVANGARVLCVPKRGLGHAYIDAIPFIRGKYVIMGDSDCTYDFRNLKPWVDRFEEGYEFIIGSRFRGNMDKDAMPKLHRYFGTPAMTGALNMLYGTTFSDIHCGMRGCTLDALRRMHLRSKSWEYASEMIVKSVHLRLKTIEIPIDFYKDQVGRVSHHKRIGWQSPWIAGWINMREILTYCADWFLALPGAAVGAVGVALLCTSFFENIIGTSYKLLFGGAFLTLIGSNMFFMGAIARFLYDFTGAGSRGWLRTYTFNRSVVVSVALFVLGAILVCLSGLRVDNFESLRMLLTGCLSMFIAFLNFTAMLVLIAVTNIRFKPRSDPGDE